MNPSLNKPPQKAIPLKDLQDALRKEGKSHYQLARELAPKLDVSEALVRQVLNGRLKGARGDARKVAKALGLVVEGGPTALDILKKIQAEH